MFVSSFSSSSQCGAFGAGLRPLTHESRRRAGHVRTVLPQASLIDRFGRVTKGYTFFYGDKVGKPCVSSSALSHNAIASVTSASVLAAFLMHMPYCSCQFRFAVKQLEDPIKMLDQAVIDMKFDLMKMKEAANEVFATQKSLEDKYRSATASSASWLQRAELALSKGEDELAREALKRRQSFQVRDL